MQFYLNSPIFDFRINTKTPVERNITLDSNRTKLGFGDMYPLSFRDISVQSFNIKGVLDSSSEKFRLLEFFNYVRGTGLGFWVSLPYGQISLLSASGDTLKVSGNSLNNYYGINFNRHLYLTNGSDEFRVSISSAELDEDGNTNVVVGDTLPSWITDCPTSINSAYTTFARFSSSKLKMVSLNRDISEYSTTIIELPFEANETAEDITITSYLYKFSCSFSGDDVAWYYTSSSFSVYVEDNLYIPAPINHKSLTKEWNYADDSVTLEILNFEGNPYYGAVPFMIRPPMNVEILRIKTDREFNAVSDVKYMFKGLADNPDFSNTKWSIKCKGVQKKFSRKIPSVTYGTRSSKYIYDTSSGVGVSRSLFEEAFEVVDVISPAKLRITATGIGITEGYFDLGLFLSDNVGAEKETRTIRKSEVEDDDTIIIYLNWPVYYVSSGTSGIIAPGSDGTITNWGDVFDNAENCPCHPDIPKTNPSLIAREAPQSGGKK